MKTMQDDSRTPIVGEAGLSWELLVENGALTDEKLKSYTTLRIAAVADCKVTVDGVDALIVLAGDTAIINTGLGNPKDKRSVLVTTVGAAHISKAAEKRSRDQQPVED